jgi:hypothetical protein
VGKLKTETGFIVLTTYKRTFGTELTSTDMNQKANGS